MCFTYQNRVSAGLSWRIKSPNPIQNLAKRNLLARCKKPGQQKKSFCWTIVKCDRPSPNTGYSTEEGRERSRSYHLSPVSCLTFHACDGYILTRVLFLATFSFWLRILLRFVELSKSGTRRSQPPVKITDSPWQKEAKESHHGCPRWRREGFHVWPPFRKVGDTQRLLS